ISGVKLIGKIKGFDKYSVILEANNQEQLIFKHAISTVSTAKMVSAPPPPPPIPQPQTAATERTDCRGSPPKCLPLDRNGRGLAGRRARPTRSASAITPRLKEGARRK